ncbi:LysM and putative peptidoglycan-binding domain-containing protein 3 [Chamberlinius hualienensis]
MSALTSLLPSTSGHKWTITKVHKRPEKKLYNQLKSDDEQDVDLRNGTDLTLSTVEPPKKHEELLLMLSESSEEEDLAPELVEMARLRSTRNNYELVPGVSNDHVVVREVEKDDSLQSLSIKYGCKISELKRKNNLITDQEFYGLKSIKIPVKRFGLVEEELLKELEEKAKSGSDQSRCRLSTSPKKLRIGDSLFGEHRQDSAAFIQQMDTDLENLRQMTKTRKNTLEEVTHVLTFKSIVPLGGPAPHTISSSSERFFNTRVLLVVIIMSLLVLPIVIFLWYKNR